MADQRPLKDAFDPIVTGGSSALGTVSHAIMAPFTNTAGHSDHSRKILTGCMSCSLCSAKLIAYIRIHINIFGKFIRAVAPVIMTPKMVHAASSSRSHISESSTINRRVDFNTIGRAPLRLASSRTLTSGDLDILESTPELLSAPIPEADGVAKDVSLLQGFHATIPSSEKGKIRRRKMRNVQLGDGDEGEDLSIKRLGMQGRAMLTNEPHNQGTSARRRAARREGDALSASKILGKEELNRQRREILQDKENLHVRRVRPYLLSL